MSFAASFRPSNRCSSGHNRPDRAERGWALVTVLWTMTVLALLAAATEALTVTSYRSERHAMVDARAQACLDAAVVRAVLGIADLRPDRRWRMDGASRTIAFDDLAIRVSVQDENGRIDLNASAIALIRQLLMSTGLEPAEADAMADRISDWRSASGLQSLNGASDADYRAARLGYVPRHGPFQTVDELKLVLGMTPALFAKLEPALTVYSKRPSFDAATAPRAVLQVLYPNDPQKIDTILRARDNDPGATMQLGFAPATVTSLGVPVGHAFSILANVSIGKREFERAAVVELTGDAKRPYFVLRWR